MNILAINGSHRASKGTAALLSAVLETAGHQGATCELIELSHLDIRFCCGCNKCLGSNRCTIHDDMDMLYDKMMHADGIVLGSPVYFGTVSARMKNFMDRTRPLHMVDNALAGKVGGMVTCSGLPDCGCQGALAAMDRFFATHEMLVVHPRPLGPVIGDGVAATQLARFNEAGDPEWRSIKDDQNAFKSARRLGHDMFNLIARLS